MAKSNRGNLSAVETPAAAQAEVTEVQATPAAGPNYTVTYRRDHPGGGALGRCSYGIPGVSGIIVFDKSLFIDGVQPQSITMSCEFVQPKADNKTAKAEAKLAKEAERAQKAQARIEAQAAKAAERQAKADKALADAKAKVEAAQSKAAPAATASTEPAAV